MNCTCHNGGACSNVNPLLVVLAPHHKLTARCGHFLDFWGSTDCMLWPEVKTQSENNMDAGMTLRCCLYMCSAALVYQCSMRHLFGRDRASASSSQAFYPSANPQLHTLILLCCHISFCCPFKQFDAIACCLQAWMPEQQPSS